MISPPARGIILLMATDRTEARRHLEARFIKIRSLADQGPPHRGWVRAIRDAIGMSSAELGKRMGIGQQRVSNLERNEQQGTVRLETLRRAAEALDCELVYFLVPREPLDEMVRTQAVRKATERLSTVSHHSRLEDQEVNDEDMASLVEDLASELVDRRGLWSESNRHP